MNKENTMRGSVPFLIALIILTFTTSTSASVVTGSEAFSDQKAQKLERQEDRLHKKIHKLQNKIIKAKEKAGTAVLDDAGFLSDADDRVRWGLVGVAGGIILSLILTSSLKFIGTLAIIGGLGLLIWYLIDP